MTDSLPYKLDYAKMLIQMWERICLIEQKLDTIIMLTTNIQQGGIKMTAQLDDLTLAVNENTSLDDSIIQLVDGLAAQIAELKDDPAAMAALAQSLRDKSAAIAAAIKANTPTT